MRTTRRCPPPTARPSTPPTTPSSDSCSASCCSASSACFAGREMLRAPAPHAPLAQPGVLRAVLMAGAYPALIALISLGIGAIIRHTAGAICAVVGVLFVLPLIL